MKYLKQIFDKWLCLHDWKLYERINLYNGSTRPYAIIDTLQCKKCGKFKKLNL